MKRKILYALKAAVIAITAFSIGKFTAETNTPEPETTETTETTVEVETEAAQEIKSIETTEYGMLITFGDDTGVFVDTESLEKAGLININEIKGWEHWDDGKIAGIELQADDWIYEITKVPYTVNTTVSKTK